MRHHSAKQLGAHIGDRTHQQAACRAALDGDARRIAIARSGEVLDAGDEVREGVTLHKHLARVMPGIAQIAAAADVRVGKYDTAVEQREPIGIKAQRQRIAI